MQAIYISKFGGPNVLHVRETAKPQPGPGEVLIASHAAGLNFAEVMARQGLYPDAPKPPCIVGYEAAGIVEAVGADVKNVQVGQRVLAMCRFGGHASSVVAPWQSTLAIPDAMSFAQAAALPVVYLTAYHMLFEVARVRPGDRVLVHMAAGGVGLAALQLLKTVPNVVVYGTCSASKHALVREQGCHHPIDYRTVDYAEVIRRETGGRGVDIVLDALGGKDWKKGYSLLAPAGRLIAFGFANMASGPKRSLVTMVKEGAHIPFYTPMGLMNDNRTVSGVNMGHLWHETELLRREMFELLRLYNEGKIVPTVDSVFPFSRVADAHARIETRQNVGKVVLVPDALFQASA